MKEVEKDEKELEKKTKKGQLGTSTPQRKKKGLTMNNSPSIKEYLLKMEKMHEGPANTKNQDHTEEVWPVMNLTAPKQTHQYEKKLGKEIVKTKDDETEKKEKADITGGQRAAPMHEARSSRDATNEEAPRDTNA